MLPWIKSKDDSLVRQLDVWRTTLNQIVDKNYAELVNTPATLTSGVAGQIAYDENYLYVCTAANTWHQISLSGSEPTPGGGGYQKALELNFKTESSQLLDSDTDYSIAGKIWTKGNSSHECNPASIISGTGINFQPDTGTDLTNSTRTIPAITIPILSLVPDLNFGTPLRAWMYVSSSNRLRSYDQTVLFLENIATHSNFNIKHQFSSAAGLYCSVNLNGTLQGWVENNTSPYSTHNVVCIELPSGIGIAHANFYSGVWSSGWPALSSMYQVASYWPSGNVYDTGTPMARPADWNLSIGAGRVSSITALSVIVERIMLEKKES
jgi:hypothetical protein